MKPTVKMPVKVPHVPKPVAATIDQKKVNAGRAAALGKGTKLKGTP